MLEMLLHKLMFPEIHEQFAFSQHIAERPLGHCKDGRIFRPTRIRYLKKNDQNDARLVKYSSLGLFSRLSV